MADKPIRPTNQPWVKDTPKDTDITLLTVTQGENVRGSAFGKAVETLIKGDTALAKALDALDAVDGGPQIEEPEIVRGSALGRVAVLGERAMRAEAKLNGEEYEAISDAKMRAHIHEGILEVKEKLRLQGQSITEAMSDLAESKFPGIVKMFYPRIIQDIHTHYSAKEVGAWLAWGAASVLMEGPRSSPHAVQCLLPAMQYLVDKRMPLLFIAPKLLQAVTQTDFQDDIDWVNLELPYEHGIFVLPRGAITHPIDGDVSFIVWSRVYPGEYKTPIGITVTLSQISFSIVAMCSGTGTWYDSTLNASFRPTLRLGNLFYRAEGQPMTSKRRDSIFDADLEEGDSEFLEHMGRVVFGTIMAMNARPGLFTQGKCTARVPAKKNKPAREFWSPNVIGRDYQTKQAHVGGTGTHASPRMHFRRGHFRAQPVGPGRLERRQIWIEPMLVSAGVE